MRIRWHRRRLLLVFVPVAVFMITGILYLIPNPDQGNSRIVVPKFAHPAPTPPLPVVPPIAPKKVHGSGKLSTKAHVLAPPSRLKGLHPSYPPEKSDENSVGPGEGGVSYVVRRKDLSPEEQAEYDKGFQDNSFNQYASDRISVRRHLPDFRRGGCKTQTFQPNLPKTAVIICFHNEAWSALLRSVHSVIDYSPEELLQEVILVDDFSDKDHLKRPLEVYMRQLPKVKIVRTQKREGLIRARMFGTNASTAEVLTFLDSHIECSPGWLPPLLDRIKSNKSNVVTPIIEIISDKDLSFKATEESSVQVGGFTWDLTFDWHVPPKRDLTRPGAPYSPLRTPTMAGGLFSIHREFFRYLGYYDEEMEVWGGENLELSFKTWMCGGQLETIVCSHVGHIFRSTSPYKWQSKHASPLQFNLNRLAETWLDEYKHIYFDFNADESIDFGDVSWRKAIREKNKCKSFQWYLDNVYPEMFNPMKALASGDIENMVSSHCIDGHYNEKQDYNKVNMYPCHRRKGNQLWFYTPNKEIRSFDACFDGNVKHGRVALYACHGMGGSQTFEYTADGLLKHNSQCLEPSEDFSDLVVAPCTGALRQKWKFARVPYRPKGLS